MRSLRRLRTYLRLTWWKWRNYRGHLTREQRALLRTWESQHSIGAYDIYGFCTDTLGLRVDGRIHTTLLTPLTTLGLIEDAPPMRAHSFDGSMTMIGGYRLSAKGERVKAAALDA